MRAPFFQQDINSTAILLQRDQQIVVTDAPTHTDVLLGRGVATNRHPGNENFRAIVSQHVNDYVTSTKKQKMMISKSVVRQVNTQLNPPGRFLEKNTSTGLWHEVDQKRALEKTAQALRDGAAPLRKQLAKDLSNIMLSGSSCNVTSKESTSLSKGSKHRRTRSDSGCNLGPQTKKLRCNPNISSEFGPEVLGSIQQTHLLELQYQEQLSPLQTFPTHMSQHFEVSCSSPVDQKLVQDQDTKLAQALAFESAQQISALHKQIPVAIASNSFFDNSAMVAPTNFVNDLPGPTTSCDGASVETSQLLQDKRRIDEEEFAQEMGLDEYFFELCNSDPIADFDGMDDCVFDSVLDLMAEEISVVTP